MADRLAQIHARRERLIAKAALQRETFARDAAAWAPALGIVDRGIAGVAWLRSHPEILVVAGGLLVVLRPRKALRWSLRAFSLWQAYRRITARLSSVRS
jgi:hypothetical protein